MNQYLLHLLYHIIIKQTNLYLLSVTEAPSLMLTTATMFSFQCFFILRVIFYILQGRLGSQLDC